MQNLKDKSLTEKEFEVARLIVAAGHHGDDELLPFSTFTYEQYLWARWFAKKNEAMCAVDHMHTILEYAEGCRVQINLRTGEQEVLDQFGDSSYVCDECSGRAKQFIIQNYNVADFEHLTQH